MSDPRRIEELMSRPAIVCRADDTLNVPAAHMLERDCGAVPVVDERERLVGIITDRDICLAAYTRGQPLDSVRVGEVMCREVVACGAGESLEAAEARMVEWRVRRLPVVDGDGVVVGVLSVSDLVRNAARRHGPDAAGRLLLRTLAAICAPRRCPETAKPWRAT